MAEVIELNWEGKIGEWTACGNEKTRNYQRKNFAYSVLGKFPLKESLKNPCIILGVQRGMAMSISNHFELLFLTTSKEVVGLCDRTMVKS